MYKFPQLESVPHSCSRTEPAIIGRFCLKIHVVLKSFTRLVSPLHHQRRLQNASLYIHPILILTLTSHRYLWGYGRCILQGDCAELKIGCGKDINYKSRSQSNSQQFKDTNSCTPRQPLSLVLVGGLNHLKRESRL